MPTIDLEAQVSSEELLTAVDQLGPADLDRFVSRVIALRARRTAPSVPADEEALLAEISEGLPTALKERLQQLGEKRESELLTQDEQAELLRLAAELEGLEAKRVERLSRLARLRGVSLTALMDQLGIRPPDDG